MASSHVEREDILGDRPLYHVFYAESMKIKSFQSRAAATAFKRSVDAEARRLRSKYLAARAYQRRTAFIRDWRKKNL